MQDSTEVGEGARRGEGHKGARGAPRAPAPDPENKHKHLPPTPRTETPPRGGWRALRSFLGRPPPDPTFRKDCFPCRPGEGEVAARWGLWWDRGASGFGGSSGWLVQGRGGAGRVHRLHGVRGLRELGRQGVGDRRAPDMRVPALVGKRPPLRFPFCQMGTPTAEAAVTTHRSGPHEPSQGRVPAQAVCLRRVDLYHLQPQGAWPAHCLWPSVSLQLRWPGLKFQLLWGHPALSPTNAASPKSQPLWRRTQVSSALTRDQEKLPPASGPPPRASASEQGRIGTPRAGSLRGPYGEAPNWPEGTQAQQSAGLQGPELRSQLHTRAQGGPDLPRPQRREEEGAE